MKVLAPENTRLKNAEQKRNEGHSVSAAPMGWIEGYEIIESLSGQVRVKESTLLS